MPCQPLLVEGNDDLRAADVGFTGRHQVCLIRSFPTKTNKKNVWDNINGWWLMPFLERKDQRKERERERKKRCLLKLWKCSIVNDSSDVESEHHRGTASSLFHNIEHLRKQCQSHHILFYCTRFNGGLLVDNIALMHHEEKEPLLARGANGRIDLTLIKESVWTTVAVLVCGLCCTVVQVFAVSLFALGTQTLDL